MRRPSLRIPSLARRRVEVLRLLAVALICQLAVACATATTPASAAPPSATSPSQAANAISDIVREEIAAGKIPGAVVVVGINDRIVLRQAYGNRSVVPTVQPATLDTVYDEASLTKVMATSVAILQLVERGKISLDQPAATYWPAFAANGKGGITVRQLMTHYAALPPGISTRGWSGTEGALDAIAAVKPLAPAGTRFVQPIAAGHNAFTYTYRGAVEIAGTRAADRQMAILVSSGAEAVVIEAAVDAVISLVRRDFDEAVDGH